MRFTISTGRFRLLLVVLLVGSLIGSVVVPPVALVGADTASIQIDTDNDVEIDPDLEDDFEEKQEKGETIEVIVQLEETTVSSVAEENVDDVLEEHAEQSQEPLHEFAQTTDGITIVSQFWVTNAVLVTVDAGTVDLDVFETVENVEALHGHIEVPVPERPWPPGEGVSGEEETVRGYETTYGIAQIGAPVVWDDGVNGAGVTVAVLDTGIDASHPDIDLYTDDPTDPTYPGGWAEFTTHGDRVEGSTPHDSTFHGTHVSGTIAGGDASGVHVGVAPEVDLIHGKVLDEENGSYAQILGGIEWAIDAEADVLTMSFGAEGTYDEFITPVRNARASGIVPVGAIGNDGQGTSGSPANVYDTVAIGATDANEAVASFSGGEHLTREQWSDPPADWPDAYVVPDLTAPGVTVYSTVPGGGHGYSSGTSMATPHVTGAVALMLSADPALTPDDVVTALFETAHKPDGSSVEKDERYGLGIVDASAAVDAATATPQEEPADDDSTAETDDTADVTDDSDSASNDDAVSSPQQSTDRMHGFGVGIALVSLVAWVFLRLR